jgi:hypothetical protein
MCASTPSTDRPRQVLGEAGVVRLVDLEVGGPLAHQLAQLEVHHARQVEGERLLRRVELVADPLDQCVRAGNRHLRRPRGEAAEETHLVGEAERAGCQLRAHHALVEVVVEPLRPEIDLDAREALGEVVDHVVALQLAVRDDVDAGDLLVLDRRLARGVVHVLEVVPADPPLEVVVLGALEPGRHRVAADHGGRKCW